MESDWCIWHAAPMGVCNADLLKQVSLQQASSDRRAPTVQTRHAVDISGPITDMLSVGPWRLS